MKFATIATKGKDFAAAVEPQVSMVCKTIANRLNGRLGVYNFELTKFQGPWVNEGDIVELEVDRIGILRNRVGQKQG